jgi:hypothetical protein
MIFREPIITQKSERTPLTWAELWLSFPLSSGGRYTKNCWEVYMYSRYPALKMVASLIKTISVLFILAGLGVSFWFLFQAEPENTTIRLLSIGGIFFSIIFGVILYALSDLFRCIMDIEANTHPKAKEIPPPDEASAD